jgi:hypothetical protein
MIEGLACKRYLGDGVYAGYDQFQIWLSTLEGQRIALEPEVMRALVAYVERLREVNAESKSAGDLPEQI